MKAQENIAGGEKKDQVEEDGEETYNEENIEPVGYLLYNF